MDIRQLHIYLTCTFLLASSPAFAHAPYEHAAGTFQRRDGTSISIVRQYRDGIFGADPVSIEFRLSDGTQVAHTPEVFDAVVHRLPSGLEVYQFKTTWLPVASRVQIFDGYALKDITSSRRYVSPFIHFAGHWLGYLVALGFAALFVSLWIGLRRIPRRGWRVPLRWAGLGIVAFAVACYTYVILVFEPISPLVLAGCDLMLGAARAFARSRTRQPSAIRC
jgi:hypothetical protein